MCGVPIVKSRRRSRSTRRPSGVRTAERTSQPIVETQFLSDSEALVFVVTVTARTTEIPHQKLLAEQLADLSEAIRDLDLKK